MKCIECPFHWREEWERYPSCHWVKRCPDDMAPCEYDDEYEDEEWEV